MRSKKAIFNTTTALIYEIVAVICGLILPRLILSRFGSSYNGITSSITQFLSCVVLLRAGVGAVTKVALYKPLAEKNTEAISSIVNATQTFMRKVAYIFLGLIFVLAIFYPFIVSDEFEWMFSFTLVLILGISTFMQYYFGITYQMLLQADQSEYIFSALQIVTTIMNTVVASILILNGASIHVVKLGSAFVFSLNPLILNLVCHKKYNLNKNAKPNNTALKQRWDAFAQSLAFFIHTNSSVIVLTCFTNTKEVSVYSVYNYVIANIRNVMSTFVNGFGAAFGNMMAKDEKSLIRENLKIYELIVFFLSSVIYTTAGLLIVPFALIYTDGVTDVEYARWSFAIMITIAGAFSCFRIPYQIIVEAAGHFKQTRNGAIVEAGLNITISIVCVFKFGLVGVAIGSLVATVFRSFQYAIYLSRNVVKRSVGIFVGHLLINAIVAILTALITHFCFTFVIDGWLQWFAKAILVCLVATVISFILHFLLYKQDMINLIKKLKALLLKRFK
ncbi:MAG: sugar isomerase [Clostridia bacterium]